MEEQPSESKKRRKPRHQSPVELLHQAIYDGDVDTLAELLDDGGDPEARGPQGYTPLEFAVDRGHAEVVIKLLDAGADPNNACVPILHRAVGGPLETLEALIIAGASLHAWQDGDTALSKAAYRGDLEAVEVLLEAGADARAGSPLLTAARQRHRQVAERLLPLESDAEVVAEAQALLAEALRAEQHPGRHPEAPKLFEAIEAGDIKSVRQWLAAGRPKDALIVDRWKGPISALRAACLGGRLGIARLLLDAGAPIEGAHDDAGPLEESTPLIDCIRSGSIRLAKRLIAAGADVNSLRDAGAEGKISPLLHLVGPCIPINEDGTFPIAGIAELVEQLAKAGADLDTADRFGNTALIWAAKRGEARLVKALLRLGVDPELRDEEDNTAQTHAAYRFHSLSYPPVRSKYFRRSSRPSKSDYGAVLDLLDSCTAHRCLEAELIAAAFHGDLRTVRRNLERGASVDHQLGSGRALDLALQQSHVDVVETLVAAGAEVTERQRVWARHLLPVP